MTKKYKLVYRKSECIGAGACAAAFEEAWDLDDNNIASLKSSDAKKTEMIEELIFDESELENHLEAAQVCPVMVIEVYELESGKKIYPDK
jgi:ferredoxin